MRYKKSYYNTIIEIPEGNKKLIYNSVTAALGILDKKNLDLYDRINFINFDNLDGEEKETVETLKENGFIVDADFDEYSNLIIESNKVKYDQNGAKSLTIAPTMNCNMKCPYCFETQKNEVINEETEYYIIEFIKNFTEGTKALGISWYGGEPLLGKDIIVRLSEKIINICDKRGIEYSADMVTNGYLLNRETAIEMKEKCKIDKVQITIDGLEDTHNNRRKLKKNSGSCFNEIIKNIDEINDILGVVIRINVDIDNINEIEKLIIKFVTY